MQKQYIIKHEQATVLWHIYQFSAQAVRYRIPESSAGSGSILILLEGNSS
ncbi:MAG: hypothetical protein P6H82_00190 [Candidatus Arsenophonus melophagi]|nr:hypothetical protein [Candidatus Arsenophonus melophagi]